jgi:hypothetical protein
LPLPVVSVVLPSAGGDGGELLEPLLLALPAEPEPPEPEQLPITEGWQAKPSPQSASTLHGSCHLKVQTAGLLTGVHVVGCGFGAGQSAPAAHGAISAPPEHIVNVSL